MVHTQEWRTVTHPPPQGTLSASPASSRPAKVPQQYRGMRLMMICHAFIIYHLMIKYKPQKSTYSQNTTQNLEIL